MDKILLLFAFIVALWVYVDAQNRDLSNNSWGIKSPIGWAIVTFLIMIIFLPGYLVTRGPTKGELNIFTKKYCPYCGTKL